MTRYINRLFLMVCILSSESQIWSQEIYTDDPFETTVGMSQTLSEIILPGSELEVTDIEDQQPFILRVTKSFVHGDAFRYHFVYYGLEPGEYNLTDYLQRKDGSERGDLPEQIITVQAVLPPGQVTPHQLTLPQAPSIGGYRLLLALADPMPPVSNIPLHAPCSYRAPVGIPAKPEIGDPTALWSPTI